MTEILTAEPSLTFLIGGLGAGKTELALNLALTTAETHGPGKTRLVDLDVVNPFFRVRKVCEEMQRHGVDVVIPGVRVVAGDLPALPAAVWGALEETDRWSICDVGGGVLGLRVLGRMQDVMGKRPTRVLFPMNPYRPGFRSLAESEESFELLQQVAKLKVTHLVANPHLMGQTTPEDFRTGLSRIREFSDKTGVPIAFGMASPELIDELGAVDLELLPLRRFWSTPWRFGLEQQDE